MHGASSGGRAPSTPEDVANVSQTLLHYLAGAGTTLRSHTQLDTLLKQLTTVIDHLPAFSRCTFYLSNTHHFSLVEAQPSSNPGSLQNLSNELVKRLTSDRYRADPAYDIYVIPVELPTQEQETDALFSRLSPSLVPDDQSAYPLFITATRMSTLIIVPLQVQNDILGLFLCYQPLITEFSLLLPPLALFADQVAVLLERTHLHEEVQRVSDEQLALIEIGRALTIPDALQNLPTIYQAIYEQIKQLMPTDIFSISCYYKEKDTLIRVFQVVDDQIETSLNVQLPDDLKQFVASKPYYITCGTHQECMEYLSTQIPKANQSDECEIQSMMLSTISLGDEPLGILEIQSYQPHSYQQKHIQFIQEISTLAATAIKSAHIRGAFQAALVQAQESERLQNRFLMTASHELRTPLTAVHGYLEMLDEMRSMLDEEVMARFINNARRASEELVLIVSTIMDASRLDQDKLELRPEAVRLCSNVQAIVEILQPLIVKERRTIRIEVPEDLFICVDDLRLRQILLNLLNNALKYTPIGTSVAITACAVDYTSLRRSFSTVAQVAELAEQQHYALISVRDWGPGVAPDEQSRLFARFARLDEAINSQQRGAGLGLFLCRQLAEAMSGAIWLESSGIPGDGCTFYLVFPLSEESTSPDERS